MARKIGNTNLISALKKLKQRKESFARLRNKPNPKNVEKQLEKMHADAVRQDEGLRTSIDNKAQESIYPTNKTKNKPSNQKWAKDKESSKRKAKLIQAKPSRCLEGRPARDVP